MEELVSELTLSLKARGITFYNDKIKCMKKMENIANHRSWKQNTISPWFSLPG